LRVRMCTLLTPVLGLAGPNPKEWWIGAQMAAGPTMRYESGALLGCRCGGETAAAYRDRAGLARAFALRPCRPSIRNRLRG